MDTIFISPFGDSSIVDSSSVTIFIFLIFIPSDGTSSLEINGAILLFSDES